MGLPIVPVVVKSRHGEYEVETYALQDSGSTGTFCTDKLLDRLKINSDKKEISLTTMESENKNVECCLTDLEVYDIKKENYIELKNVFSRPKLPVTDDDIPKQDDVDKWPHLNGLHLEDLDSSVDLLIDIDNNKAIEPKEIIEAKDNGPYAVKTILGWSISGPLLRNTRNASGMNSNFVKTNIELHEQFERYCNMEFNDTSDQEVGMSRSDKKALAVFEDTIKLKDGHYEVSLPWKEYPPNMPNNENLAQHRLQLLKKRFLKDEYLFQKYSKFIDGLLEDKYAEEIPNDEIDRCDGILWTLPHHPVVHPKKSDKLRVVFDCASSFMGTSLNENLLQGPDLTNSLFGVLTRFRQERVALMSDVQSMFHQVHVTPDQRDVFRFLWWKSNDLTRDPVKFRMKVHIFGAVSSPSVCNYALLKTAEDNIENYKPNVIETVKRNFYVDDHLKSLKTEEEAIAHIQDITSLLRKGGFRLTKWNSNSKRVLENVPSEDRAVMVKDLDLDKLPVERALGILWDMENDSFTFKVDLQDKPATRRGILSIMSSVFDPLGFVAPLILPAKIILQELCRIHLDWDDVIPEKYLTAWLKWLEDVKKLSNLQIPRCIKPVTFSEVSTVQLHHFSDSSESGYGAVSYIRLIDVTGNIHCSFIAAKSRVTPLKVVTIPRLELSAATLSVRLNKLITKELDVNIEKSTYWTDSTSVLKYINNKDKRFKTFVANRIAFIHDGSDPSDWSFINGALNPGDEASRGISVEALLGNTRWWSGPEFLWRPEEEWMEQPNLENQEIKDEDPEVKREKKICAAIVDEDFVLQITEKYSSWHRAKKIIAWIIRYKSNLQKAVKKKKGNNDELNLSQRLSVEELKGAELEIIKHVQKQHFSQEISSLQAERDFQKKALKGSSIFKLDPILVNGILRVGGRLRRSEESFESKHQIILPKKSHVSMLIIRHYHEVSAHSGRSYILSAIRRRFWIIKGNSAVRNVISRCLPCRKRQAPVGNQKMADLPKSRVTPDLPAFSSVGVDCFGPFMVKRGRSELKRWGCIFTCLACRAVHLEILHTMDTDSFINGLRRFIARRGCPVEIRSDNGSNFVGGNKEL
ncbi:hypothetical protein SNE40_013574 [Patella caerulea]|uniref:Pro-Pol polyprotein n=1 Tax=Patella caerulea TaxID=87958 RepID=A0AAN8PHD2_PATCE